MINDGEANLFFLTGRFAFPPTRRDTTASRGDCPSSDRARAIVRHTFHFFVDRTFVEQTHFIDLNNVAFGLNLCTCNGVTANLPRFSTGNWLIHCISGRCPTAEMRCTLRSQAVLFIVVLWQERRQATKPQQSRSVLLPEPACLLPCHKTTTKQVYPAA